MLRHRPTSTSGTDFHATEAAAASNVPYTKMDGVEKGDAEKGAATATKKPTFKLIAQVVMAMKRFQAALNPTYSYGKRAASPTTHQGMPMRAGPRARAASGPAGRATLSGPAASGERTLSGRPDAIGKHHGFKGQILFKPLPELPGEQEASA